MQYRCVILVAGMIPWLSSCGSGANAPAPAPAPEATATEAAPTAPPPPLEAPKIRVDKFEGHVDRVPGGLKIRLETDLPDNTYIHVMVARDFAIVEDVALGPERETRDVGIFYLDRDMTVADARSDQLVLLDKKVTQEQISKSVTMASGFHGRLASVAQVVSVTFQFGCTKGYEGDAIKPCHLPVPAMPVEASWETKVPVPYP